MSMNKLEKESLIMNHKAPLSVTLRLAGTSRTLGSQTEYWLNVKDISINELEEKCSELERQIHLSIFGLFSKELTTV